MITLSPYARLVGYYKLPYGIRNLRNGKTTFYTKAQYDLILRCDGETEIDKVALSEGETQLLQFLLKKQLVEETDTPKPLAPYQKYIYFDNRFKEHVQWSVTGNCNYRCRHCFMSAPDAKFTQPSLQQCREIIEGFAASGVTMVSLTGGEPLIRQDLLEIIDMLLQHGIALSTIYTNGALLDKAFLDALLARHIKPLFQFSYDGKGCHDWMRGIDGAEEDVLRAMELVRENGFPYGASMALHKHNIKSIRETVNFLAEKSCSYIKINIAEPCGNWAEQQEHFATQAEVFDAFLAYLPQFVEDGMPMSIMLGGALCYNKPEMQFSIPYDKGLCAAFEKLPVCSCIRCQVYLSPEGVLLPCMSMISGSIAEQFPSVNDAPLPQLLKESYYTQMMSLNISDFLAHNPACASCPYVRMCQGGCRAIAVGATGEDILAPDPESCLFYRGGWYEKFRAALIQTGSSAYKEETIS